MTLTSNGICDSFNENAKECRDFVGSINTVVNKSLEIVMNKKESLGVQVPFVPRWFGKPGGAGKSDLGASSSSAHKGAKHRMPKIVLAESKKVVVGSGKKAKVKLAIPALERAKLRHAFAQGTPNPEGGPRRLDLGENRGEHAGDEPGQAEARGKETPLGRGLDCLCRTGEKARVVRMDWYRERSESWSIERRPRRSRLAGFIAGGAVLLALAVPAWASATTIEGTATLAPIGTGSYLLTVTNTGTGEIKAVIFGGENLSNFASSPALSCSESLGHATCGGTIEPSASAQVCYSGPSVEQVQLNFTVDVQVTSAPAVSTCPVPGFTPATGGGGGGGSGGGGSGGGGGGSNPAPSAACVVPKLIGKKLAVAKKKLKAADCTLGKVKGKKTKSATVSGQSPAPGKTLASGAKVNVTVK